MSEANEFDRQVRLLTTGLKMAYDDPRKYRISMSGFSIKTGWGEDKRIVAAYPGKTSPLNQAMYLQWLSDAELICERHNAALPPNAEGKRLAEGESSECNERV